MRKMLSVMMAATIAGSLLAGCSSSTTETTATASTAEETTTAAEETTTEAASESAAENTGDENLFDCLNCFSNALVDSLDGLDRCVLNACVAYHIRICKVYDDNIIFSGADRVCQLLTNGRCAHLRLKVICCDLRDFTRIRSSPGFRRPYRPFDPASLRNASSPSPVSDLRGSHILR